MTQGLNFPRLDRQFWRRLWDLIYPYFFRSEERLSAWLLLITGNLLLFVSSSLVPIIFKQLGELLSALNKSDQSRFYHIVYNFAGVFLVSTIAIGIGGYCISILLVRWRNWLSQKIIGHYLEHRAYYKITSQPEIDNPDLRIAKEIETLLGGIISLNSLISVFSGRSFFAAGDVWGFSHNLVIILAVFGALSTWFSYQVFFKALFKIKYIQQKYEGNFRTGLVKVRENAESIAFYRGEEREKGVLENLFEAVFTNWNKLLRWQYIYFYSFVGPPGIAGVNDIIVMFLAYAFTAPKILSGQAEIGLITSIPANSAIFCSLFSIFGQIIDSLSDIFNALVRVEELNKAIELGRKPTGEEITTEVDDHIAISDLTLKTPEGERTLFTHLNMTVNPGESLLIMGKSGVGKSSFLRALAGLWLSGTGLIIRPDLNKMFFLPQRPYMGLGTLRQQLLYPQPQRDHISQAELEQVLVAVNLQDLPERVGGYDIELDWAKILSPGEQQRLSFARVLLSASQFIILDEATSALDPENEERLYNAIAGPETTIISVGHRSSLQRLHDKVLQITPEDKS